MVGPVHTLSWCALSVSAMAQTLLALKKQPWLVSGTTAHTVKSTWPPAMSSSPQLLSTIRKYSQSSFSFALVFR